MHSVTDRQTDRRQNDANSRSYCVEVYDRLKTGTIILFMTTAWAVDYKFRATSDLVFGTMQGPACVVERICADVGVMAWYSGSDVITGSGHVCQVRAALFWSLPIDICQTTGYINNGHRSRTSVCAAHTASLVAAEKPRDALRRISRKRTTSHTEMSEVYSKVKKVPLISGDPGHFVVEISVGRLKFPFEKQVLCFCSQFFSVTVGQNCSNISNFAVGD